MELTKKELANIAGYTYRRLYDIDRDLPPEKKLFVSVEGGSKYDLSLFVQRWVQYNVERDTESVEDLDVVKARHEVVKTQKTELEVARMRGELIDVQDVRKLWGDVISAVVQNFLQLSNKVAPIIRMMESTEEIADIINAEVRGILTGLTETPLPEYAVTDETEEDDREE